MMMVRCCGVVAVLVGLGACLGVQEENVCAAPDQVVGKLGSAWEWVAQEWDGNLLESKRGLCSVGQLAKEMHDLCFESGNEFTQSVIIDNFAPAGSGRELLLAFGGISRLVFSHRVSRLNESPGTKDALVDLVRLVLKETCDEERGSHQDEIEMCKFLPDFRIDRVGRLEAIRSNEIGTWFEISDAGSVQTVGSFWYLTISNHKLRPLLQSHLTIFIDGVSSKPYLYQYSRAMRTKPVSQRRKERLVIMSQNVWNTMPHPGLHWSLAAREARYRERMDYLVQHIHATRPDILALQEMRYDLSLGSFHSGPSQLDHVLRRLRKGDIGYSFFVYQPAMALSKGERTFHGTEGLAVLSRFPIVKSQYKLLSRQIDNPQDTHQRICLCTRVDLPRVGLVDVFTLHLALDAQSQNRSIQEVLDFADHILASWEGKPVAQMLMGDFNAEPHHAALRRLFPKYHVHPRPSGDFGSSSFRDVWLDLHAEPKPRSRQVHDRHAFTFPSDDPRKRIDFLFLRGDSRIETAKAFVVGQEPRHKIRRSTKVSMESPLANLWASDHLGIAAEFTIHPPESLHRPLQATPRRTTCTVKLSGKSFVAHFPSGAFSSLADAGFKEYGAVDKATLHVEVFALELGVCCKFIGFEHGDYSGQSVQFYIGAHDLTGTLWADRLSSFELSIC